MQCVQLTKDKDVELITRIPTQVMLHWDLVLCSALFLILHVISIQVGSVVMTLSFEGQ